jgi:hypothetical protein
MSIANINVITTNQINNNKVGLFRSITTNNDNVGTIKNLNLTFDQVFANDNTNVGALAGEIKSGIIYNLNIDNQSTVVQGRNLVGGVAGKITGNTHLVNIKVKTSVNSGYRESVNPSVAYDIYDSNNDNDISYAGAVAGVLDVTHNSVIENISVYGKSSVISENAGGVFGLVGESTTVNNVSFEVNSDQIIRTTKVAGGIVAENRGYINNGIISHKSDVQQLIDNNILNNNYGEHLQNQNINLFAGTGQIAGGLIGFNNGGSVYNSTAKVDVRNSNILIAGGLIGRVVGGSIGTSYAYGSVLANQAVGGLIGSITDKSLIIAATGPVKQEYANNISDCDYDTIINNSTSYNNWLNTDHNILVNGYSNNKKIVIGGLVGVIQLTDQENYFVSTNKGANSYINSLYSPQNYLPSSNWYIMNEYGLMNESLGFLYSDSNKLYQVPSDYDYTNGEPITYGEETITPYYNNDNEIAEGVKVFDLYQ